MTNKTQKMSGHLMLFFIALTITGTSLFSSCTKQNEANFKVNQGNHAGNYSSEVLDKWMTMQIRLMRNATGIPNQAFSRHFAYAGVAAFEAISPGVPPLNRMLKINGLTSLPVASPAVHYYLPANVNAALAAINRSMFPNANHSDKTAIDSLENALKQEFLTSRSLSVINASEKFGQDVATAVFQWSESDGYKTAGAPYSPPAGPGLWVPTAPAFANASTPYWGNLRPIIKGSTNNTEIPAPLPYSTDPNSGFYKMVKHVYDVSQTLTDAQKEMAVFWRDVPGVTSPGHWLSILQQAISKTNASLEKAAIAYALTGAAINDGLIACWKMKYHHNLIRPISFIRDVMGHGSWSTLLGTPPHPEYPSAHAVLSVAAGEVMDKIFSSVQGFTDNTYNYLGMAPRNYPSFSAIGHEAAQSRLYAGIHYQQGIDAGIWQGKKVSENILNITPSKAGTGSISFQSK
jgi:hypothetical protein